MRVVCAAAGRSTCQHRSSVQPGRECPRAPHLVESRRRPACVSLHQSPGASSSLRLAHKACLAAGLLTGHVTLQRCLVVPAQPRARRARKLARGVLGRLLAALARTACTGVGDGRVQAPRSCVERHGLGLFQRGSHGRADTSPPWAVAGQHARLSKHTHPPSADHCIFHLVRTQQPSPCGPCPPSQAHRTT